MRDVLEELVRRGEAGETVGLGTVVSTWNSAPPSAGAAMFAGYDGSLSDGCGEGAVYELARQVVADGTPVLERCGVSGDDAFLRALPEALGWRRFSSNAMPGELQAGTQTSRWPPTSPAHRPAVASSRSTTTRRPG